MPVFVAISRRKSRTLATLCLGISLMTLGLASKASAETLNLEDAIARAIAHNPSQRAAQARIEAAEATTRQAAVKPLASIGLDVENLGSESEGGLNRTETTLSYQHTLERGGKRDARINAARSDVRTAELRRKVAGLDLIYDIEKVWVEALAADAEVVTATRHLDIAKIAQAEVKRRVAAARDPLFAGSEAETAVARAELDLEMARAKALRYRQELAGYWGGAADFDLSPQAFDAVLTFSTGTGPETPADLALLEQERESANARIRVEEARTKQDATIKGGVRYFSADGSAAIVVGGAIPLGRAGYNQGNIDRAQAERRAIEGDIKARRLDILRQRSQILSRLDAGRREVNSIDRDILPKAELALAQVSDGYARGGFRHSDVITAARSIQGLRARRIEVLKTMNLDLAALHRLDGRYAGLVPTGEVQP